MKIKKTEVEVLEVFEVKLLDSSFKFLLPDPIYLNQGYLINL